jgi:hypothetical protein
MLELLGHRQRMGFIREVEMFGGKLLRIDIPTDGGDVTEFYGVTSVYALRPASEQVVRDAAKSYGDPRPVQPVDYQPHRLTHANQGNEYEDDDLPI